MKNKQTKKSQPPSLGKSFANQTQARAQLDARVTAHLPPWRFYGVPFSSRVPGKLHIFQREELIWLHWDSTGTIDPRGPGSPAAEGNKAASVFWEGDGRKIILAEPALSSENSSCQKIPNYLYWREKYRYLIPLLWISLTAPVMTEDTADQGILQGGSPPWMPCAISSSL